MRIDEITLVRYGHFTDFTLALHAPQTGQPDIHIIHGANEAGKSTVSNAIMDLFFKMPRVAKYAFLHEPSTLEVSATLSNPNGRHYLRRLKTKLLDESNNVLSEDAIDTHNLSREGYRSRFWFDDESLHEGGESILNNKGELGAALFAATSGLTNFSDQLDVFMQATDKFYLPGRRTNIRVKELHASLKTIQAELRTAQTSRTQWNRLKQELENKTVEVAQARAVQQKLRQERAAIEVLKNVLTQYRKWEFNDAAQQTPIKKKTIPAQWFHHFSELQRQHHGKCQAIAHVEAELNTLSAKLETQKNNKKWKDIRLQLDALSQTAALYLNERKNQEDNQAKLETAKQSLQQQSNTFGNLPSLEYQLDRNLELDAITTVNPKVEEWLITQDAIRRTTKEKEVKLLQLDTLPQTTPIEQNNLSRRKSALERLLSNLNSGDNEAIIQSFKQQQLMVRETQQECSALRLELQSIDQKNELNIRALNLPSNEFIRQAENERNELRQQVKTATEKETELLHERQRIKRSVEHLENDRHTHSTAMDEQRQLTHAAWKEHKLNLETTTEKSTLTASANEVEDNLHRLFNTIDVCLNEAEQIGKVNTLKQSYENLHASLQEAKNYRQSTEDKLNELVTAQDALFSTLPNLSLDDSTTLLAWVDTFNRWKKLDIKLSTQLEALEQCEKECTTQTEHLWSLLEDCKASVQTYDSSNKATLTEVFSLAKSIAHELGEKWQADKQITQQLSSLLLDVQRIDDANEYNTQVSDQLLKEIELLVANTWIENIEARNIPPLWSAITDRITLLREANRLQQHIYTSKQMINATDDSVRDFSSALGLQSDDSNEVNLQRLIEDHQWHTKLEVEQDQAKNRLAELTTSINKYKAELNLLENSFAPMHAACGTTSLDELQTALQEQQKEYEREQQQLQREQDICTLLGVTQFTQARERIKKELSNYTSSEDNPLLEGENEQAFLAARLEQLGAEEREADSLLSVSMSDENSITQALQSIALDDKAANLRQREADIIGEIEDGVMEALKLRLGLHAIRRGIQHYRDQNRGGLLEAAKTAFTALTQQKYTNLSTQPNDKGVETLIATEKSGRTVTADGLSVGTRYQLYLALRIAAYHEYRQHRTPLPFIADDIFETFDEQRTQSALLELAAMAQYGQVIYFTHHQHVVNLAQETIPSVNTIRLVGAPAALQAAPA